MMLTEIATHELVTAYGDFNLSGYLFGDNQQTIFALWKPGAMNEVGDILLRIQYGCINGTVFKAIDCDCALQLDAALRQISKHQRGILVYFPDHEAFGLG